MFRRTVVKLSSAHVSSQTYKHNYIRDSRFSRVTKKDVEHFKTIIPYAGGVLVESEDIEKYTTDWTGFFKAQKVEDSESVVLRPKTTEQISNILKYCNKNRLAVVPQSGNTGLVGGSVPVFDEVLISLSNMNQITSFDSTSGVVVCDAGVVLENLEKFLVPHECTIPVDLAAKGSCCVGGVVSTNAGGIRLLRYGSLHGNVLGIEAVLPDGQILDTLSTLRKDNTGLDIKQLFIGAEGSLGIVTKVALQTPPKPKATSVAFFGLKSFEAVQHTLKRAKTKLGEILSAFELLDRNTLSAVVNLCHGKDPFSSPHEFYVLVETSGSNEKHDMEKLNIFLEEIMNEKLVDDGVIAQDSTQAATLWSLREQVAEAGQRLTSKEKQLYRYDISLPSAQYYDIVVRLREKMGPQAIINGFGHVGDGNLHIDACLPPSLYPPLENFVYEYTQKYKGSVSAEHGMGLLKHKHLHCSKPEVAISSMWNIKKTLDPNGIMNPYKVLPSRSRSPSS